MSVREEHEQIISCFEQALAELPEAWLQAILLKDPADLKESFKGSIWEIINPLVPGDWRTWIDREVLRSQPKEERDESPDRTAD